MWQIVWLCTHFNLKAVNTWLSGYRSILFCTLLHISILYSNVVMIHKNLLKKKDAFFVSLCVLLTHLSMIEDPSFGGVWFKAENVFSGSKKKFNSAASHIVFEKKTRNLEPQYQLRRVPKLSNIGFTAVVVKRKNEQRNQSVKLGHLH